MEKVTSAKPASKRFWRRFGFAAMLLAPFVFFLWFKKTESPSLSQPQALFSQSENAIDLTHTPETDVPAVLVADQQRPSETDGIDKRHTTIGKRIAEMDGDYPQQFLEARMAFENGDPQTSERILSKLLSRANTEQYAQAQAMASLALAKTTRFRNPQKAKTLLLQAKLHYFELRDQQKFHEASFILALVHLDLGDIAGANEILRADLSQRGRRKRQQMVYYALVRSLLYLKTGELFQAEKALLAGKRRLTARQANKATLQFDLLESAILLAQGNLERASQICWQIVLQANDLGHLFLDLQARWLLAQIEAARNQHAQSAKQYFFVQEQAKRFEMDFFLAKTTWTLEHSQSMASDASNQREDISHDHRLLIERLVNRDKSEHVSDGAQLFNL